MADLHVVVVNYRTPDDLAAFLASLERSQPSELSWALSIVNVDPHESDEEAAAAAEKCFPGARIITHTDNVGYAVACNHAVEDGEATVLAFFNADVELRPGALDDCWYALLSKPNWGILGPRQIDQYGRLTAAGIFGTPTHPVHRGWLQPDRGDYADVRDDAVSVAGSAFFVRQKVWDELCFCPTFKQAEPHATGAFLPTKLFYEETWACYHAAAHGWRNVYYGRVQIVHKWHRSVEQNGLKAQVPQIAAKARAQFRNACAVHGIVCD